MLYINFFANVHKRPLEIDQYGFGRYLKTDTDTDFKETDTDYFNFIDIIDTDIFW